MFGDNISSSGDRMSFQRIVQEAILHHGTHPVAIFNVVRAIQSVGNFHQHYHLQTTLPPEDEGKDANDVGILGAILNGKKDSYCVLKDVMVNDAKVSLYYSSAPSNSYYLILIDTVNTCINVQVLTDDTEIMTAVVERLKDVPLTLST